MEAVIFLSIIIALFSILVSCFAIRRVKKQIAEITDALIDVKNGNGNRRILSATNELVAPLAYEMILSRLVDTFFSRISPTMQLPPKHHSIAYVLPWAEGLHWQSRSSGCSNS